MKRSEESPLKHAVSVALLMMLTPASQVLAQERNFDLPADDLAVTLPEYARQAGMQIVAAADLVEGASTRSIKGVMDARVALQSLLAGSGLSVAFDDGGTIVLGRSSTLLAGLGPVPHTQSDGKSALDGKGGSGGPSESSTVSPKQLDTVSVTGSRLKRSDVEGANPLTTISRAEIEASGEVSVADFLRSNVFSSFGSAKESAATATSSAATISLRGLGAQYTLVLLDGRRMTNSPSLSGGSANINLVPSAAVERIEILREGAGAIYGSDAVGGVVNIILRDNYEGVTTSVGMDWPRVGSGTKTINASGGISSDRGNFTFVVDHQERDMTYNREIKQKILDAGLEWGLSTYNSSAGFLGSSGLHGVADCDTYENSYRLGAYCGYDHGATSAHESDLERNSAMFSMKYYLSEDTELFFRGISSETEGTRIYAAPNIPGLRMPANSPYNPFGEDGALYYRFDLFGTRDTVRTDRYRDYQVGVKGRSDWLGGMDWELGVAHGRVTQSAVTHNMGFTAVVQDLINTGQFDPFNPLNPINRQNLDKIITTSQIDSEQRTVSGDGHMAFDLFDLPAGSVGMVLGFEYRDDRLSVVYDEQSAAGKVFGISGGTGLGGDRSYHAMYFEAGLPLTAKWNATLAGRYDSYNDFGGKFSPRVSTEFRPTETTLMRASWGNGFRAPTLEDLHGSSVRMFSNTPPLLIANHGGGDEQACAALQVARANIGDGSYQPYPVDPCGSQGQYAWFKSSNRHLAPEESTSWSTGVVWSPSGNLSASVDYYNIDIKNIIDTMPYALAFRYGDAGMPGYGVERGDPIIAPDGTSLPGFAERILLPLDNGARRRVRGVDLELAYGFESAFGRLQSKFTLAHQFEFQLANIDGSVLNQAGTGGLPKDKAQLNLGWLKGPYSVNLATNYLGSSGAGKTRMPSWTTFDLQANFELPWNARLTVGARNLGNRNALFNAHLYDFPYYNNGLYSIGGRTPYVRYEQNF